MPEQQAQGSTASGLLLHVHHLRALLATASQASHPELRGVIGSNTSARSGSENTSDKLVTGINQ